MAPWVPFTDSFLAKRCQLDFVRGIVAWPVAKGAARFEKISENLTRFWSSAVPADFPRLPPRSSTADHRTPERLSAAGLHHGSTFVSTTRGPGRGLAPSLQPDGAAVLRSEPTATACIC